jgi:hypothetical protein
VNKTDREVTVEFIGYAPGGGSIGVTARFTLISYKNTDSELRVSIPANVRPPVAIIVRAKREQPC